MSDTKYITGVAVRGNGKYELMAIRASGELELADLAEWVSLRLENQKGRVKAIAKAAGVPYHTAYRIATRRAANPGYHSVRKLANVLLAEGFSET